VWLCKLKEVAGRASHKSLLVVLIVAYGDREDFCRFCALCLPEGKAQGAEPAKENRAEAKPLHERDF